MKICTHDNFFFNFNQECFSNNDIDPNKCLRGKEGSKGDGAGEGALCRESASANEPLINSIKLNGYTFKEDNSTI